MMLEARINYLLERYQTGQLSPEEREELMHLAEFEAPAFVLAFSNAFEKETPDDSLVPLELLQTSITKVTAIDRSLTETGSSATSIHTIPATEPVPFVQRKKWWIAAAVVLLVSTAFLKFMDFPSKKSSAIETVAATPIGLPGKEGAVLTLADGSTIILDSLNNGLVGNQFGTELVLTNGQLSYTAPPTVSEKTAWNTMSTPKGRQFMIVLSDQSKVWLNCASSIKFPAAFESDLRKVEVTGEAYFEVAKDNNRPFIVQLPNGSAIEVTGTEFNVSAYDDEPTIKTTLLSGGINYASNGNLKKLVAGEQIAEEMSTGAIEKTKAKDLEEVVAWKNGLFSISKTNFPMLMRQLSRWYNVEVVVKGELPVKSFSASISRTVPLESLLKAMEVYGIRSKMENGALVVYP